MVDGEIGGLMDSGLVSKWMDRWMDTEMNGE